MFNGSYEQQSNYVTTSGENSFSTVRTSGQNPSSTSTSSSRRVNANNPSSGLGFQYDSGQPDLQYQTFQYQLEDFQYQGFSQTADSESDVASTIQVSSLTHPTPLSPGNYSREARGGHAATPYWQPMTSNVHSGQTREAGATFTEHPASVVPYPPGLSVQPPSPGIYARPNAQGMPAPIWQLSQSWIDYEGGDDLYVITLFKKIRST